MRPAVVHLTGDLAVMAGDTYALDVQVGGTYFTGQDLNDWDFEASIRRRTGPYDSFGDLTDPPAEFTCDLVADVDGSGTVTLTLDPAATAALDSRRQWVWDLQAVDATGDPHTLARGLVAVIGEVTATIGGT